MDLNLSFFAFLFWRNAKEYAIRYLCAQESCYFPFYFFLRYIQHEEWALHYHGIIIL